MNQSRERKERQKKNNVTIKTRRHVSFLMDLKRQRRIIIISLWLYSCRLNRKCISNLGQDAFLTRPISLNGRKNSNNPFFKRVFETCASPSKILKFNEYFATNRRGTLRVTKFSSEIRHFLLFTPFEILEKMFDIWSIYDDSIDFVL